MPRCKNCKTKFVAKYFLQKFCLGSDACIKAISKEIKAKVFAQYLGQKCRQINTEQDLILKGLTQSAFEEDDFICIIGYEENFLQQDEIFVEDCQMILKPLSSIIDEHAIEVGYVMFLNEKGTVKDEDLIMWVKGALKRYRLFKELNLPSGQLLQSFGYDVPNIHLTGQTLKEAGLAIYE